ncbi:MAG: phosphoribosylanthranilate isomerase [Nitratireductor sp.]|nr:phosphoribosylanthranilate isomerase [Nitratireductor sp.]
MPVEIKICGLSTPEALETCASEGADMAGFIFFDKSPRNVTPQQAASLAALARGFQHPLKTVAVTVDAEDDSLDAIVAAMKPDFLQLHGRETPQRVAELKKRHGLPAIKAFAIREASDLEKLVPYEGITDRFLLDAKAPEGSDLPGGNGISFDWELLQALDTKTPWMLSGGLDAENIAEALAISGATSIDVSSGVEAAPGRKDIAKIAAFIKTVRDMPPGGKNYKTAAAG